MASHTQDDGFHEIQLNGKQLVFLFMAATVVSVVIFLCGVFVGRGVRAERGIVAQAAALNETPAPDVVQPPPATAAAVPAGADPTTAAPPQPADDLSYFNRLEKTSNQSADDLRPALAKDLKPPAAKDLKPAAAKDLKPAVERTPPPPSAPASAPPVAKPASVPAPASAPVARTTSVPAGAQVAPPPAMKEPIAEAATLPPTSATAAPGDGFAVQVAAVNVRSDADAIVKRLASKGYAAYVQVPPNGTGSVFRVRVGTFKTRHEADLIAARLQKEEQIKPWVTR